MPQTAQLADKALRVDPYSGAAYGALVFVLGAVSYLLWKELKRQQKRNEEHLQKTLGVLQMIESRLPTLVEMNHTLKDIEREVETVKEEVNQ
jgi:methylthioribose-1-phosphate isomerase